MSDDEFSSWQKKLVAAIIIALVGGNAGFLLNKSTSEVSYDPFTGTEGRAAEHRVDRIDAEQLKMIWRMQQVEKQCKDANEAMQEHFRIHP